MKKFVFGYPSKSFTLLKLQTKGLTLQRNELTNFSTFSCLAVSSASLEDYQSEEKKTAKTHFIKRVVC